MDWIPINQQMPEKGERVKILCNILSVGVLNEEGWSQPEDVRTEAIITHWAKIEEKKQEECNAVCQGSTSS